MFRYISTKKSDSPPFSTKKSDSPPSPRRPFRGDYRKCVENYRFPVEKMEVVGDGRMEG